MIPELFHWGSRWISSYEVLRVFGFGAGLVVFLLLSRRSGLPWKDAAALALFGIVVSVLGGRWFAQSAKILENFALGEPAATGVAAAGRGGGVFYGGLTAGSLFVLWYCRRFRLPFWRIGDALAPAIALGHALMKIGCFLAGCCSGLPTRLPWGVIFPGASGPVHPAQLYESGLEVLNFVVLMVIFPRKKFDGAMVSLYLINYSIIHFLMVYVRDEPATTYLRRGGSAFASLSVGQFVNILGLFVGAGLWMAMKRRAAPR